jgi:nitroimidazol reductase NimA-like FMN-containing flavoprotein (pyridoxamine 5'-phosphate oxidase superfamily)
MKKKPRRKDRTIENRKEMEALLDRMAVGRLGLTTNEGPYVVPLNYLYADGCIYLHSSLEGRKMDILRDNPRVCFLVDEVGPQVEWDIGCGFTQIYESVMCFGSSELVEDHEEKRHILEQMIRKFTPSNHSLQSLDAKGVKATAVVKIQVDWMTSKANRLNSEKKPLLNRFLKQREE